MNNRIRLKKNLYGCIKKLLPDELVFFRGDEKKGKIALTFDDGPFPGQTEKILEVLKTHNIKATFFMNGTAIEKHKELFEKVIGEGHEVGSHLYNHRPFTDLTYNELNREITEWKRVVNEIAAMHPFPNILRPPHGRIDLKGLWCAWKHKWTIVHWSFDTRDLDTVSLDEKINALKSRRIASGDIILMHDDSEHIEEILEWIIQKTKKQGYAFSKISELLI